MKTCKDCKFYQRTRDWNSKEYGYCRVLPPGKTAIIDSESDIIDSESDIIDASEELPVESTRFACGDFQQITPLSLRFSQV